MLNWICDHYGDILVLMLLGTMVIAILRRMRRKKTTGGCCGTCKGCNMGCCQRGGSREGREMDVAMEPLHMVK